MSDGKTKPRKISDGEQKLLDSFKQEAFGPIVTSADDLVHVAMNSRFDLTKVQIKESALRVESLRNLEKAILTAVNAAYRDVAQKHAELLKPFTQGRPPA